MIKLKNAVIDTTNIKIIPKGEVKNEPGYIGEKFTTVRINWLSTNSV